MKAFFVLVLVASVLSGVYALFGGLGVMGHNHYEFRQSLLDASKQQPDHLSESLGLTPKELSQCDRYVAKAYKEAVNDGYRLGSGYNALVALCLALSALCFLTSIIGIRALSKRPEIRG